MRRRLKLWEFLLELLYPTRCAFCHQLTQNGAGVCPRCREKLPYTRGAGLKQSFPHVSECVSPLYYEGDVRASLLRYKFHGVTAYAKVYGEFLSKSIDESQISCDIITWVPLSRRRLRRRGYDQARLLAEELAGRMGLPCAALLRKTRDNPAQSGTGNAAKRKANVAGLYEPVQPELFQGKRVLLVDDIVTTGATLSECAKTLHTAGAARVSAITVARRRD